MTVQAATARVALLCNGATTVFPVNIQAYNASDFLVLATNTTGATLAGIGAGASVVLTLNSDYTMAASGTLAPPFWALSSTVTYPTGINVLAILNPTETHLTQYPQGQTFPSLAVQTDFDRLTQMVIRLSDQMGRTLRQPDGDVTSWNALVSAAARANTLQGYDASGNPTIAPSLATVLTQAAFNALLNASPPYVQTPAEAAAGVVPVTSYPVGNMLRYGLTANSAGAAAANTTALRTLFNPSIANGPSGQFYFPNTTGADVYWFSAGIAVRDGVKIDLQQCTLNLTGTGVAGDSGSGLFTAIRDFECKNGFFSINWATGPSTSSGNAIAFGTRESDIALWPLNPVFDSSLASPMRNLHLANLTITSTITGANVASVGAISLIGGLQGVLLENIKLVGSGTGGIQQGIIYEFGWATASFAGDAGHSTRQSSHMRNCRLTNIDISNYDNVANSFGIILAGAYNLFVDGYRFSGVANGINIGSGECLNFRPWALQDDIGLKRGITLNNITGEGFSNIGVVINGSTSRSAGSGYLQVAWTPTTPYVNGGGGSGTLKGMTVINGGNMYVCTVSGTSAGAGGPTGTGSGIVDGTVTWDYVPLSANTDLYDFSLTGFALSGATGSFGIYTSAGHSDIKNGSVTGSATGTYVGILATDACGFVSIDNVNLLNLGRPGISFDFGVPVWSPARLKKVRIVGSYIAGCSQTSAGTYGAIEGANFDSLIIEGCRFGYETAYAGINEVSQAQALFVSSATTTSNVRIKNCRVGGSVGGIGFISGVGGTLLPPCIAENCSYNAGGTNPVTIPLQGSWVSDLQSATAAALATGGTISTNALKVSIVNPAAASTGVIMQSGSFQGQPVTVINQSANLITMAAAGTSGVADGVSCTIPALTQKTFMWDTLTALWYHS